MPRVKEEDRQRTKRPKTRTGCRTCKIRRVKCDEARPACRRCRSTGRKCDGYEVENAVSRPHGTVPEVQILNVFTTPEEQRAFQFFRERTSVQLTGSSDSEFWNGTILQAAHQDEGIRHAILALAGMHEDFEKTGEAAPSSDSFAMLQYNFAIRNHIDALGAANHAKSSIDTYLVSCIIFICVEMLQGHYLSAQSLVRGAVKLFYEAHTDALERTAWPLRVLDRLLSHLQTQTLSVSGPNALPQPVPPRFTGDAMSIPKVFSSLAQARHNIDFFVWSHTLTASKREAFGMTIDLGTRLAIYQEIMTRWKTAFFGLLTKLGKDMSPKDQRDADMLKIRLLLAEKSISIHRRFPKDADDQALWDDYEIPFMEMLRLAESILKYDRAHAGSSSPDSPDENKRYVFTLDFGLISPLYEIARMCRDPALRRKAIRLLRENASREGMWDGYLAALVANRQVELEEGAVEGEVKCSADVPGWARMANVVPTFAPDVRKATLKWTRNGGEEEWEEVIDY